MELKYGPYSPSRLETATCPYLFRKLYIEKNDHLHVEHLAQARGSAVHEIYEKMTAKMLQDTNYNFTKEELIDYVTEALNRHPAAYPISSSFVKL